jgi:HAE1 family hydrophobic/amphiphilic exporter-1
MVATGAGAIGNRTIGTAAAGGMLFGTIFGVIIIPGLYVAFATIAEKFTKKFGRNRNDEKPFTELL